MNNLDMAFYTWNLNPSHLRNYSNISSHDSPAFWPATVGDSKFFLRITGHGSNRFHSPRFTHHTLSLCMRDPKELYVRYQLKIHDGGDKHFYGKKCGDLDRIRYK